MCQLEKNGKLGCFCIFNCDYCWRWFGDAVPVGVAYFICTRDIFLSLHQGRQAQQRKVQETHYLLVSYLSLSPCYLQPRLKLGLLLQVFMRSFTTLVGSGHPNY